MKMRVRKPVSNRHTRNSRKRSASSSDDDLPLSLSKTEDAKPLDAKRRSLDTDRLNDPYVYSSLCESSPVPCEFCEVVSKSRYGSFIHNVKHIIIPLINQSIHRCQECLYCFTSYQALRNHQLREHPSILETENCFVFGTKPGKILESQEHIEYVPSSPKPNGSIKSRLKFEEDVEPVMSNSLLIDLTKYNCQVNLQLFKPPWTLENGNNRSVDVPENGMIRDNECPENRSVCYEELMKPGMFCCLICAQVFTTRLDLIKHKASHLILKNTQINLCNTCDQYILGDRAILRHHQSLYHRVPIADHRLLIAEHRLPIADHRLPIADHRLPIADHRLPIADHRLHNGKDDKMTDSGDERKCRMKTSTLMLCDVCFAFCKSKTNVVYKNIGNLCEIGKRFTCDKCSGVFFEIRLVKRLSKHHSHSGSYKCKKKTNQSRLKNISHRLKMLKMYYFVVLFC